MNKKTLSVEEHGLKDKSRDDAGAQCPKCGLHHPGAYKRCVSCGAALVAATAPLAKKSIFNSPLAKTEAKDSAVHELEKAYRNDGLGAPRRDDGPAQPQTAATQPAQSLPQSDVVAKQQSASQHSQQSEPAVKQPGRRADIAANPQSQNSVRAEIAKAQPVISPPLAVEQNQQIDSRIIEIEQRANSRALAAALKEQAAAEKERSAANLMQEAEQQEKQAHAKTQQAYLKEQQASRREQEADIREQQASRRIQELEQKTQQVSRAEREAELREQKASRRLRDAELKEQEVNRREQDTDLKEQQAQRRDRDAELKEKHATRREVEASQKEQAATSRIDGAALSKEKAAQDEQDAIKRSPQAEFRKAEAAFIELEAKKRAAEAAKRAEEQAVKQAQEAAIALTKSADVALTRRSEVARTKNKDIAPVAGYESPLIQNKDVPPVPNSGATLIQAKDVPPVRTNEPAPDQHKDVSNVFACGFSLIQDNDVPPISSSSPSIQNKNFLPINSHESASIQNKDVSSVHSAEPPSIKKKDVPSIRNAEPSLIQNKDVALVRSYESPPIQNNDVALIGSHEIPSIQNDDFTPIHSAGIVRIYSDCVPVDRDDEVALINSDDDQFVQDEEDVETEHASIWQRVRRISIPHAGKIFFAAVVTISAGATFFFLTKSADEQDMLQQGLNQLAKGQYAFSVQSLTVAASRQPHDPRVFLALARAYVGVDQVDEAWKCISQAQQLGGGIASDPTLASELAKYYRRRGDFEKTAELLRPLAKANVPGQRAELSELDASWGDDLLRDGKVEQALRCWEEVKELQAGTRASEATARLTTIYQKLANSFASDNNTNNDADALKYLGKLNSISENPKNFEMAADLLEKSGQLDQAIDNLRKASSLDSKNHAIAAKLAEVLSRRGKELMDQGNPAGDSYLKESSELKATLPAAYNNEFADISSRTESTSESIRPKSPDTTDGGATEADSSASSAQNTEPSEQTQSDKPMEMKIFPAADSSQAQSKN